MARASTIVIALWVSRATQARALVAVLPFIRTCNPPPEDRITEAIVATDRLGLQQPLKQDVVRDHDLWAASEERHARVHHQTGVLSVQESRILCVSTDLTDCMLAILLVY